MCSREAQAKMEAVNELVCNMGRGVSPDSNMLMQDAFYTQVLNRLAFFQRAVVLNDDDEKLVGVEVAGKPALDAAFASMKSKMEETPQDVKLMELENFQAFKWLLGSDEKLMLADWVRNLLKQMAANQAVSKSASSNSGSAATSSSSARPSKAKPAEGGQIMSYFG